MDVSPFRPWCFGDGGDGVLAARMVSSLPCIFLSSRAPRIPDGQRVQFPCLPGKPSLKPFTCVGQSLASPESRPLSPHHQLCQFGPLSQSSNAIPSPQRGPKIRGRCDGNADISPPTSASLYPPGRSQPPAHCCFDARPTSFPDSTTDGRGHQSLYFKSLSPTLPARDFHFPTFPTWPTISFQVATCPALVRFPMGDFSTESSPRR